MSTIDNKVKVRGLFRPSSGACRLPVLFLLAALFAPAAHAEVDPKLVAALENPSPKVRLVAVAGVVRSGDATARALLEGLAADKEATVRAAVANGLATLGDPAALATLRRLKDDPDAAVKKMAAQAERTILDNTVFVDTGDVADLAKSNNPALLTALQKGVEDALKGQLLPGWVVQRGGEQQGYGLQLRLRSLRQYMDGGNGIVEVKCEMTLVELPGKILRLSSSATAAAGVEGAVPARMVNELAGDGIAACAPSLAKDFIDYARQRGAPRSVRK